MNSRANDFETLIAGVLEQDGITMVSPEGVHRRARRAKRQRPGQAAPSIFFEPVEAPVIPDHVAELDREGLGVLVHDSETPEEYDLSIRTAERPRSAYVLSLRDVRIIRRISMQDRVPAHAAAMHEAADTRSREDAIYGTLLQDLIMDGYDPRVFSDQFTPADFRSSYRAAHGPLVRIRSLCSMVWSDLAGIFQRIEITEHRVANEAQEAVRVIETARIVPIRAVAGFAALVLLVTLPAQAVVLSRSATKTRDAATTAGTSALQDLRDSAHADSVSSSAESLKRASSRFREADDLLTQSKALALGIAAAVPSTYRTARAILELGDKTSEAARLLAVGFDKVFSDPGRRLDERLDVLGAYARGVLPLLSDATKAAENVDVKALPKEQQASFQTMSKELQDATVAVREFAGLADFLTTAVGKEHARRYLVVFQNNTELRPSGGFMGSLAEVTFDRGAVSKLFVPPGGTYDLKGQLLAHVISPEPLHLINAHWQFQDANWYPDFPTTASKLRWFWSKSGQPTVDGVIAVNASFVERLLDLTGPIDMPEYGKTIDRSNFLIETQKAVEIEYDHAANTPKKFVGDLLAKVMDRAKRFQKDDWISAAAMLSDALATKDIQVAFSNPDEEVVAERYGWNGQLKSTMGDSLALVEANIAGQKTDGVIHETVNHIVQIQPDASLVDRVTVTRTHGGTKGELFRGVRNVSYIRLYVPKGSELIDASGFDAPPENLFKKPDADYVPDVTVAAEEQTEHPSVGGTTVSMEGDRTVFGGWAQLDPGQTQTITYRYRLPWTVRDLQSRLEAGPGQDSSDAHAAYSLLLTSQSGKSDRILTTSVQYPSGWSVVWSRGATSDGKTLTLHEAWDRDRVIAALFAMPSNTSKQ